MSICTTKEHNRPNIAKKINPFLQVLQIRTRKVKIKTFGVILRKDVFKETTGCSQNPSHESLNMVNP